MADRRGLSDREAALRGQAARALVDLFDRLYEGAVAVDREARVVWMNDKYKALLGWNGVEPVEGRPVEEVIPGSQMRRVVETGRADLVDIFPVGDRQTVVSRIPLTDEDGRVTGGLGLILFDRVQALQPLVSKFQRLQEDLATARRQLAEQRRAKYSFSQFVGVSQAVRDLKRDARRAAERDATVLLIGETGTGKELLAHAIHAAGPRADRPMVRVSAAAIPETLLEAELFGAAPGAYTGVDRKGRTGKFELAHGGTLFLDEVGDMPLSVQAKLLRVLQEREVEPLGGNRVISVDVRVIAATSRDLKAMVRDGDFRADLYYRLNVLPLTLPPLRDRVEDLAILCDTLLERMAVRTGQSHREVAAAAIELLARHAWPGNVRELNNVLEQAAARDDARELGVAHFAELVDAGRPPGTPPAARTATVVPLRQVVAGAEKEAIVAALEATGGVKTRAARLLGISRAQFYEKIGVLGIPSEKPDRRGAV